MSGISAAPLSKLKAVKLEQLSAGAVLQTLPIAQIETGSTAKVFGYLFQIYQSGQIRLSFTQSLSNTGYNSNVWIDRRRDGVDTQLSFTQNGAPLLRVFDLDISAGDLILFSHSTPYGSMRSSLNNIEISTNGETIWPFQQNGPFKGAS